MRKLCVILAIMMPATGCQLLTGTAGKEITDDQDGGAAGSSASGPQCPDDAGDSSAPPGDGGPLQSPTLFLIGGGKGNWGMGGCGAATIPQVLAAPINSDGTLGEWTTRRPLNDPYVHDNPAVIVGNYGYILGEFRLPSLGSVGTVLFSDLTADGKWAETTAFDPARGGWEDQYGAATDGTFIFLAGGGNPSVQEVKVATTGGVGPWTEAPTPPYVISQGLPLVTGGYVYVLAFGSPPDDAGASAFRVMYAPIGATGAGTWIDAHIDMADVPLYFGAAALGSQIYLVGGNYSKQVSAMALGADHAPASPTMMAPLPDLRSNACVIAGPKAIYVIGGDGGQGDPTAYATAFYSIPTPDGSIVAWQETTKLPSGVAGAACAIY